MPPHAPQPQRPLLLKADSARERAVGIALLSLATLCFSVLDTTAKWLVQDLPVVQVVWLRFVTHVQIALPELLKQLPAVRQDAENGS